MAHHLSSGRTQHEDLPSSAHVASFLQPERGLLAVDLKCAFKASFIAWPQIDPRLSACEVRERMTCGEEHFGGWGEFTLVLRQAWHFIGLYDVLIKRGLFMSSDNRQSINYSRPGDHVEENMKAVVTIGCDVLI